MNTALTAALGAATLAFSTPAHADEIFGGLLVHDVKTPLTLSGLEGGIDLQAGWRGGKILGTPIQPYVFGSLHSAGQTHFAAAGLSAKFGEEIYIRPGIGLAIHSGSDEQFVIGDDQIAFGSRILIEPELSIGTRLNDSLSIEASWIHLSHGQFFSGQNPGMDSIGLRANLAF
ncbi:acyloxyacyl hydrolase [Sphingomicrobium marinum]|uniref:acyloxyacyl hydrolase n=1 Tax=Sphingomicrobium marinum TaxID=1227950 RepID=UPI00223EDAD8|nr:acyloxyacyl hydrolase [Sphingomicrobium marinum]